MRRPADDRQASAAPVLAVRGLEVRYGDFGAVTGVDLTIEGPGLVALVGPSGCGKTSLLRAIAGFEVPSCGSIEIRGATVYSGGVWVPPERRQVGMVFQDGALFPHLNVEDNVGYGLRGSRSRRLRVAELLALVGLEAQRRRFPDELSGGQRQRVALARALAPGPQLILLDEPFASLDEVLRLQMRQEVKSVLDELGASGLLVTHDQEEALSMADRVVVMVGGSILQAGSPEEIYGEPASLSVARFFGASQLLACTRDGKEVLSALGVIGYSSGPETGYLHLRPEDLRLEPVEQVVAESSSSGTIIDRQYLGHDVLDHVRLDSGLKLEARVLAPDVLPLGSRVRVSLRRREYRVFAADDPSLD